MSQWLHWLVMMLKFVDVQDLVRSCYETKNILDNQIRLVS